MLIIFNILYNFQIILTTLSTAGDYQLVRVVFLVVKVVTFFQLCKYN